VEADYRCEDEPGGSGLDSCTGDVADGAPIDTSSLGEKTFTVTARDRAGNVRTVSHGYTVCRVGPLQVAVRDSAPALDNPVRQLNCRLLPPG
jgi:hypothetical protein